MRTTESNEFYSSLPRYVFICPDVDIDPVTHLPFNTNEYCVVTIDDVVTNGVPIDPLFGTDMILWAVLEPGEKVP